MACSWCVMSRWALPLGWSRPLAAGADLHHASRAPPVPSPAEARIGAASRCQLMPFAAHLARSTLCWVRGRKARHTGTLSSLQGPGLFAGIDAHGRLLEAGWQKFPSLLHLVWAAQWEEYKRGLEARLQQPALVVPVFERQVGGGCGGWEGARLGGRAGGHSRLSIAASACPGAPAQHSQPLNSGITATYSLPTNPTNSRKKSKVETDPWLPSTQVMGGEHGVRLWVEGPPLELVQAAERIELDMELTCLGTKDAGGCAAWVHMMCSGGAKLFGHQNVGWSLVAALQVFCCPQAAPLSLLLPSVCRCLCAFQG